MTETKQEKDEKFDAERNLEAERQNLPEGAQPERRPQAFIDPAPVHSETHKKLVEANSPLVAGQERMDRSAFELAEKRANDENYEDEAAPEAEFLPGTTAYIDNPRGKGKEHHGRAVAVNAAMSRDEDGLPVEYECRSRDGRAEFLVVSHKHLRSVPHTEFHRTVT